MEQAVTEWYLSSEMISKQPEDDQGVTNNDTEQKIVASGCI